MATIPDFSLPNLDGLDEDDLVAFQIIAAQAGAYASHRLSAMILRKAGDIVNALIAETKADDCYKQIPAEYRW